MINLVTAMYLWFNQIADPSVAFHVKDLEKYFSPDFVMQMNETILAEGYASLYEHFERFRRSGYHLEVQLPLKEVVLSDDKKKCVVRYAILKKSPDKATQTVIHVIAIWHLSEDGRLQRMNEVVAFDEKSPH
jgi:hypothetical protein